ncbi:type III-B CRISPR module-associated protein Cmr5 [Psychrobacter sp. Pi2-1]|uniref:type III-B CRISPR module-associated protein Cmr5 n=1 Tax=Psychrobacter sp. Pi2-1 TaxID=2774131 RepID=UPI001917E600|nr:type III-B CRISPR module-associated protein Cmr5 [Psychrobacter sp. Pi2-1]
MKIRTHKYAELAYPLVNDIKGASVESKYRTLALTFPSMIMQSGLAQAIGFLMAKNKEEHQALLEHIAKILNYVDNGRGNPSALHQAILSSSVTKYQLLSREALDASAWLKRYTQALLEKQS